MPFGMAGLDFCVRNPYRNREKTFFAEGAYWKSRWRVEYKQYADR